jgi:hypothetical protein
MTKINVVFCQCKLLRLVQSDIASEILNVGYDMLQERT